MRRQKLDYNETATIVIAESEGYRGKKASIEQHAVKCIFIQELGFSNIRNQELLDADAIMYVDTNDEFISDNHYRLEGMYVLISPFGASAAESWYRVGSVSVNRDHLLSNGIDNVACILKKAEPVPGVS